ncbi:hypothetical protein roselon_00124 [Roseibacterium elongatum DSM 19469]|uniref:Uncharacterized protein n=1 Tax=Roseicyclus elongatus DSM 19469 TaxID=1294273 RepID=W8RXN7_9RHOB|nr:hypothetical protein [Roseibacterium elongatum]AHM02582.1 hypothetical protein roselon_00124 [Roseibacterium elongatum DSM 19469]
MVAGRVGGDDMAAPVPAEHHDQDDAPIDRDVIAAEEAVADILGEQSAAAPDDFEPETGDVDWPGSNAERALRDLAAARGAGQPDMPVDLEPQPPEATDTAAEEDKPEFTPIFSRRRSDELARPKQDMQVSEPEGEPQSETETVADQDTAPVTAPPHAQEPTPEDAKPETALPDHEAEARVAASGPTLQEVPRPERDPSPVEDDTGHDAIEDLGDEASPFTFPEDEAGILDEETLREIVAEVVREELQGPLGQRITRNVRKMVRREIRLMLAADELD